MTSRILKKNDMILKPRLIFGLSIKRVSFVFSVYGDFHALVSEQMIIAIPASGRIHILVVELRASLL